eukprot:Partr_v1_DN27424_c0_g1_i1_m72118 putative Plays a role in maintaining the mitochondrial genome and in controlling the mtDNA escape. Involved in the regulation of mtDNA nucleotide structure and number. May have a dispensable role in early maturation of pre-rRNA (By similarity)
MQTRQTARIWFDALSAKSFILKYRPELLNFMYPTSLPATLESRIAKEAIRDFLPKPAELHESFAIDRVLLRFKDRGVLMEVSYEGGESRLGDILTAIRKHLGTADPSTMANSETTSIFRGFDKIRAFLVKGEPFLEDLSAKRSSTRLKIDFHGPDPPMEKLYSVLRPFGRLSDIRVHPNKDGPRFAVAIFRSHRGSCSAKLCANGLDVAGTRISTDYVPMIRVNLLRKMISDHPRIFIPIGVTALAAASYSIFDPLRTMAIRSKVSGGIFSTQAGYLNSFQNMTKQRLSQYLDVAKWFGGSTAGAHAYPSHEFAETRKVTTAVKKWLEDNISTVLAVVGPKGYGTTELVESVASKRKNKLVIRCDEIAGSSDVDVIPRLARQVGYFPYMSLNRFFGLIETLVASTTGQKVGLATSYEGELRKVLQLTSFALAELGAKREVNPAASASALDDFPVVIISNYMDDYNETFASESSKQTRIFYSILAEWASFLASSGIAHVVFVSSGGLNETGQHGGDGLKKLLANTLPSGSLEVVTFSDASPDESFRFLKSRLFGKIEDDQIDDDLNMVVKTLGGRLSDLENFIIKVKGTDMSITEALDDLVLRSMNDLRKYGIDRTRDGSDWTSSQFWFTIKALASTSAISFHALKNSPIFGGNEAALISMNRADLIYISYENGVPLSVTAAKPLHHKAMEKMASVNSKATTDLDMNLFKTLMQQEDAKAKELEAEIKDVLEALKESGLKIPSDAVKPPQVPPSTGWLTWSKSAESEAQNMHPLIARYQYLVTLLGESQTKLEKYWRDLLICKAA